MSYTDGSNCRCGHVRSDHWAFPTDCKRCDCTTFVPGGTFYDLNGKEVPYQEQRASSPSRRKQR